MEDLSRRSTLSVTFILFFSLCLTSGETSDSFSFFNFLRQQCFYDCPTKHFTATYKVPCKDSCETHGYNYYWCNTRNGWDYCSPNSNVDYQGSTCQNPCGNYGENYNECKILSGDWMRCGQVEPKAMIYYTTHSEECLDSCQYYESGDYFWCYTEEEWNYCSPLPDYTYKNEPCRQNHKCGTYGEAYSWCYTTYNNDWDYCGMIYPGECEYSQTRRSKRQPDNSRVICRTEDNNDNNNNNNRRATIFIEEGDSRNIASVNKKLKNEALQLINRWDNQRLSDRGRSNLITSDNLRIDNQGLCNRNNERCYNLQIQINQQRISGQSTTIAQILVPLDTSAEYMRQAFRQSLEHQVAVVLDVNNEQNNVQNINQRCCKAKKKKG